MAGDSDETQLTTRFAAGDASAFDLLYARHKGPTFRYFLRQCGQPDKAAELFLDTWTAIIKGHDGYPAKVPFTAYAYKVAHTCLADYLRKAGRPLTAGTGAAPARDIPDPVAEAIDPAFASARWSLVDWEKDPAEGAGESLSAAERADRLLPALESLPAEQREAFLLHEEAALGLTGIAAITGADVGTVRGRLRFAIAALRARLGDPPAAGGAGS